MKKYSLVVYHREYEAFLRELQELELMDITTSAWEPNAEERSLMARIEQLQKGSAELKKTENAAKEKTLGSAEEAFGIYSEAYERLNKLNSVLERTDKDIEEVRPWGDFSHETIERLQGAGVTLHFYSMFNKEFGNFLRQWQERYAIQEISRDSLSTYFIIAAADGQEVEIDAQPLKAPLFTAEEKLAEKKELEVEIKKEEAVIARAAPYAGDFSDLTGELSNRLHFSKVVQSGGVREAGDTLVVLEGWAAADTQEKVDGMLENSGVFYIKEEPSEEDIPPVKLRNNRFAGLFEMIGNLYALPKYGTTDLTPYWAPFYAIFFGFCLGDAGYGLLYLAAGLFMVNKLKGMMKSAGWLVICCAVGTIVFGMLTGNVFGIQLAEIKVFDGMKRFFVDTDGLFSLAIAFGFVHLLYGMTIRVTGIAKRQGFKYAAAPLGWMIVILSLLASLLLPSAGIDGFSMNSPAFIAVVCAGLFLMLFLNSPGKNPLFNFGAGLWNTYNDITGLLSDVLSYIRLFALGLSGGVLAMVFNDLARGLSPDIPVVKQLVMLIILLIGHGINLFMSSLSSFVHPMRLTFVEFYKNAGFEPADRVFNPLKK